MSSEYFTRYHIDLLTKWQGRRSDRDNPEQKADYRTLKQAYDIVGKWAEAVQEKVFPLGRVKIRRSPVNQGGNFFPYLWAKIYPTFESPEALAYTVHISTDDLAVKIDTVNATSTLTTQYSELRGDYNNSSVVARLSHDDALSMTFEELVKWTSESIDNFGYTYDEVARKLNLMEVEEDTVDKEQVSDGVSTGIAPLNQILYGPPGTGKTYHTIEAAVQAAEPDFYASLDIDAEVGATETQRDSLTQKYQSLTDAGRIRFVTFHQSYGYEEFVEGLKANSEEGEISYDVEKGIFRQICDQAAKHTTERAASKTHSFELSWQAFSEQLAEKESVEITMSQTSFRVIDFNAKRIFFEKSNGKKDHTLSINTLKEIFEGARDYTSGLGVYYNPLVRYLKDLVPIEQKQAIKRQNYVLVIDEINRGNISKIFGELITLIEPSKRKGADEELELQLPLSRADEKFSVPDNLHIIGTMNTADRSLAMMDTALRRRFDFVEMMPRADLFSDHRIEWQQQKINLQSLLEALNKRIEVLYDREHTLGHAFLFPAYNAAKSGNHERAFVELKAAFKNKIIPLLEEYFYEDWNKIRLVLGDSLKQEESLRFLQKKEDSYTDLFGPNHGLDLYEDSKVTYSIKPFKKGSVWDNPQAYKAIYAQESE